MSLTVMIKAPFSDEQVKALKEWQASGVLHPMTCPDHDEPLTPTSAGLKCEIVGCVYVQLWAPPITVTPSFVQQHLENLGKNVLR